MRIKDLKFWTKVHTRREAYEEAIRIKKTPQWIAAPLMPPSGSPPFAYRPAFEAEGHRRVFRAEVEEARRWFLHRVAISKAEEHYRSRKEFAIGVYRLELRDSRRKAFARSGTKMSVAKDAWAQYLADSGTVMSDCDNGVAAGYGPWRQRALPISSEEWVLRGLSVAAIPDELILSREDRDLCARILAKSPGRKRGRPPNGERALSSTERSRKHRAKEKV